jgi:hypothetical protein
MHCVEIIKSDGFRITSTQKMCAKQKPMLLIKFVLWPVINFSCTKESQ